jgi:signal peptidase
VIRVLARLVAGVLAGLGCGLALALLAPLPFGGRALTVMSSSMTPALDTGDLVVTRRITPAQAGVGDVISFRDPTRQSRLLTHRVRRLQLRGERAFFVTKGDAAQNVEEWVMPVDGELGRVAYAVPRVGYALHWLSGPWARLGLLVVPALLLLGAELRRIWRPRPGRLDEAPS